MSNLFTRPDLYLVAGLILMLIGAIDPLEGSLLIVPGIVVATIGAFLAHDRRRVPMVWACVLVIVGVALMFGLSAFGGVGGTSGHSRWWLVILLPYPIGWVMGIVVLLLMLRRKNGAAEASH